MFKVVRGGVTGNLPITAAISMCSMPDTILVSFSGVSWANGDHGISGVLDPFEIRGDTELPTVRGALFAKRLRVP